MTDGTRLKRFTLFVNDDDDDDTEISTSTNTNTNKTDNNKTDNNKTDNNKTDNNKTDNNKTDNNNGNNSEPLPLVNGHEDPLPLRPADTTANTEPVRSRKVQADQTAVQAPSLDNRSNVESQVQLDIPITSVSRWTKYKLMHTRNLGGPVFAVVERLAEKDDYLIRKLAVAEAEISLFRKRRLSHKNLCQTLEVLEDSGEFYCVMEPVVVTLRHVRRCPQYPSEENLAAIARQVGLLHTHSSRQPLT